MEKDIIYSNEFLAIKMINPNYPFLIMKKNGAVTVPYDSEGNIYMLHKSRPNIGTYYELPRGFVENDEDFISGAVRELLEETGMECIEHKYLGEIQPDTGIISNKVKAYEMLVDNHKKHYTHYDKADKELVKIKKLTKKDVEKLILDKKIVCGYTLSALNLFWINQKYK
ncbi:NUDIX hydrolase [Thermoanaerobacterium thermosaccharolyticum]|uniref:NUDIX hydrolase n=1 Tax=Thermoanaerobacterium thermosaccharolyticum TaxID=1517 RepID=UPI003DA90973